jgi:hypothetical protein
MHDFNLFADIKKLLIESHTKEEIKALSTSELKKLHKEYLAKDTDEAKKEADEIKKEIESRGEEKDEDLNEARFTKAEQKAMRRDWVSSYNKAAKSKGGETNGERLNRIAREKMAEKKAGKSDVAEQNEELLAILDTLCEMAGLDMVALVEETRKEMENLGHAYGWDQPAPEGVMARTDRLARVKANMARLGKRRERGALKTGEETAYKIEMGGEDLVHEPTAKERAKGAPAARRDMAGYDKVQDSIEKISDKFTLAKAKKEKQNKIGSMGLFGFEKMQGNKPRGKGKKK